MRTFKVNVDVPGHPSLGATIEALLINIDRARRLCALYEREFAGKRGRKRVHQADVLRAAVVLAHAGLEDVLRRLVAEKLPLGGEDALNRVALKGLNETGRPEKFLLGTLAQYRGMTVNEVIAESVAEHLSHCTYSSVPEVVAALEILGIDQAPLKPYYPDLAAMISRRHQIVHSADQVGTRGKGKQFAESIRLATVRKWIDSTYFFLGEVALSVLGPGVTVTLRRSRAHSPVTPYARERVGPGGGRPTTSGRQRGEI